MLETPLDHAHEAMQQGDEPEALRFYERLAATELFMLLTEEAEEDSADPLIVETSEGPFALVFDREDRLAEFAQKIAPYIALSGRKIIEQFAGQDIGLGLNPEVAPSSILMPPDAVDWMAQMLRSEVEEENLRPIAVRTPDMLPDQMIEALDERLAMMVGLADRAYLVTAQYEDDSEGNLLVVFGALPEAEIAIADAIAEMLAFSGMTAAVMDVAFLDPADPLAEAIERNGIGFELPEHELPEAPSAPGMDPDRPPKLR